MRLLRIRLEHFRGVEAAEIELDPSGVTLITGRNETGKTSVLDAVTFAFAYPDNSRDRRILAAKPVHRDEGPFVEVELTTGAYHLVFSKRWLKRPATSLRVLAPRPENLTGRQAHDRLEAILGETLDRSLLSALHYQQGVTIQQAALGDCSSLSAALDAATSAGGLGGEGEETLWERVCRERLRFFTETGRPLQYRKDLEGRRARAGERVAELERRVAGIEGDAGTHHRNGLRLALLGQELAGERPKRDAAETAWRAASKLVAEVDRLDAERRLSVANADAARKHVSEREQLVREVEDAQSGLDGLRHALAQQVPAIQAAEGAFGKASQALATAREERSRAQAAADVAAADDRYWRTRSNHAMYQNRRETVERAEGDRQAARLTLDTCRLDEDRMGELERGHEARSTAAARLDAARASLAVEALAPIEVTSSHGTQALAAGERTETPVATSGEVVIEGVARVVVTGAASDRRLEARLREAEEHFAELLVAAGLQRGDGIDAARAVDRERRRAVEREHSAEAQMTAALHDLPSIDELDRRIAAGEEQMASHVTIVARSTREEHPLPPDKEAAERAAATADDVLRSAQSAERECDGVLVDCERAKAKLVGASLELRGKLSAAESRLLETSRALDAACAETADEALAEALTAAVEVEVSALGALDGAREALERAGPDRSKLSYENQVALVERLDEESAELRQELARLAGSLERAGEQGVQEGIDAARQELEVTTAEATRTDGLAAAADRLWRVLGRKRDEARRAYVAPYREALQRLSRLVFGSDFAVEVDERTLEVTDRTIAMRTVRFDQLSTGTQEQLCVLSRLACAMIVSPAADGSGAPVIIDDALGYTDHERLESMALAFSAARESCQVIVLICVPERYGRIGSARVVRLDDQLTTC
ncbi:MAG: ATP-binding protein [Acidimicrobiales bacterium]